MALAKANRKAASASVDLPECPVCLETMSAPIFQCSSGHSLCSSCTHFLCPSICPICRQPMTQMRNWQLEEIILKAKVPCPNKSAGCVYVMSSVAMEDHIKECIFREMDCPIGAVFGRCSWNGKLKDMMSHFKEKHPMNCNITSDTEVKLENINIREDERFVYLFAQGKLHFIITVKIDTLQKMAYWAIQLIGGKSLAYQHIYEIHVLDNQDERRKVVFIEHCCNDAIKADEIFRLCTCAMIPLEALKHFIPGQTLSFRFFIKRMPPVNKANVENKQGKPQNNASAQGPNKNPRPKGPKPNKAGGPGMGTKGPFPKGPRGAINKNTESRE